MGSPVLARTDDAGDRFYVWKGETFWSVTTLISGGVPKFGLPPWYAKMAATLVHDDVMVRGPHARAHAAIRRWAKAGRREIVDRQALGELVSISARDLERMTDAELAIRYLSHAPIRARDAAADLGVEVHDEAEQLVLRLALDSSEAYRDGLELPTWPEHLVGHMAGFVNFLDDWHPVFRATETTVFNRPQAYAGTLDAIFDIEVRPDVVETALTDYKSGNVYPEVGMQLAAYARGEFVALPDRATEAPMPRVDAGYVLRIRPPSKRNPRGYTLRPVRIDDRVFEHFLHAREGFRWKHLTSSTVLGEPLTPWRKAA